MQTQFESRNPATEAVLNTYALLKHPELEARLAKSSDAQKKWCALAIKDRVLVIETVGSLLEQRAEEYGELMHLEMGKLLAEGVAEAKKCASLCAYSAKMASQALSHSVQEGSDAIISVGHDALGVILAVMPWNFPFWQLFRAAVPTLLAGNTILMKHAMNTPQCALAIEALFAEASGLPILQSLFIDHDQVGALIADRRVAGVTLTGSKRAGVAVAIAAANAVKPCILELGGSDPFIVFADADLEEAARVAVQSRCINNGQSCIAAKRFIVERTVFDRFVKLMTEKMVAKEIGPQATRAQQQTLKGQVDDAVAKGAHVHCGGAIGAEPGFYYPPTVLSQIASSMRVAVEEVFGPVACLYAFASEDEALQIANDSDFGLGATVFTNDKARIEKFTVELSCGQVFINDMVRSDPRFPFGGIKESGFGRELGPQASLAFTNEKTVWIKR